MRLNKSIVLFAAIASLIFLFNCKRSTDTKSSTLSDAVVLIFKNPPSQKFFYYNSGSYGGVSEHSTLRFVCKGNLFENFDPSPNGDTISIPCFGQQYIIISHKYKGIETHEFLVSRGDTIEVCYDSKNFPLLQSRLSDDLTTAYNFNYFVKGRTANFNLEPLTLLCDPNFIYTFLAKNNPSSPFYNMKDYINLDSITQINQQYARNFETLLDSVEKLGRLGQVFFNFYRQRLENIKLIGSIKPEARFARLKQVNSSEKNTTIVLNDSLIYNYKYQKVLHVYVALETKKEGIAQYTKSNSRFPDYRTVFDKISNDTTIPNQSKAILLTFCLDGICDNFPINDKQQYLEKFIKITNDTTKEAIIKKKYNLDFSHSQELLLTDVNGISLTFDQAISTHKGNVIYVDFWASWCSPCREEMSHSVKLHERYKGKGLIFMNIVVWDTFKSWTLIKPKFENNPQIFYYFAVNSQTSRQLENLKVDLIPHFMLYDRKGKLVNQNAPRPKNQNVYEEIDRWF